MRHAELFYSGQICILFLDLSRGSLHRYSRMKVFVTCGGTQLCQINVVNFWDSPLAQSQSLRPPEWWSHNVIPRAEGRPQYQHKEASLNGVRQNRMRRGLRH